MRDVMLDLETLGTAAGCVVISIGAVFFSRETGQLGEEFHLIVNRDSCLEYKLVESESTRAWWDRQSPEARKTLDLSLAGRGLPLPDALKAFQSFLYKNLNHGPTLMWGNGSDFDNPILACCYDRVGMKLPWKFWNNRCFRTLKDIYSGVPAPERLGTYHNALDDAKTQATHAAAIFMAVRTPPEILVEPGNED